ncbi:MAG: hypothetical protein LBT31_06505 [Synergistaceae bacterium]|jgi:hypothetical protein|nr:hypothetical protein [Synergistaceae bacterium]
MLYRQIINADALESVISVPPNFKSKKVEVVIRIIEEKEPLPKINLRELDTMMEGSAAQALCGILENTDKDITLDEIRTERLSKYERAD